jgi:hypothetical protein
MLLFRSEEHVDRWCKSWNLGRGAILSTEQTWQLAQAWHSADRRDPAWRRRTVDETEEVFRQLGLTDNFWNLR